METIISWLVLATGLYGAIGLLFALYFAFAGGAARADPNAKGGTLGFRLLIIPAAAALWPWLLRRALTGATPPIETNPHRKAAQRGGAS